MSTDSVALIFKCINLVVFGGAAFFLVKTHLIPLVREKIIEHQKRQDEQEAHENNLKKEIEVIADRMYAHKIHARELIQKAQEWKSVVEQREVQAQKEHALRKKSIENYLKCVQEGMYQEYLVKETMPDIINQLEHEALDYYRHNQHVVNAFDLIFGSFKKRTQ